MSVETLKKYYDLFLRNPVNIMCCLGLFFITKDINTWVTYNTTRMFSNASAAFIEETARLLSIYVGGSVAILFSPFLAIAEFFLYINREQTLTHEFVTMRMICIGIHMSCFFIQYFLYKKYQLTLDKAYIGLAYVSSILLHLSYNSFLAYYIYLGVSKLYLV